jgi:hypothetical protein
VDASGGLPDGSKFTGIAALEQGLLNRPETFASTLTEKLLTFALGRGVETTMRRPCGKSYATRKAAIIAFRPSLLDYKEHAVHHEENIMIITKKFMPRRTFLRGVMGPRWRCRCWRQWCPPRHRSRRPAAKPVRRLGFVFMPMGCDQSRWTPPG